MITRAAPPLPLTVMVVASTAVTSPALIGVGTTMVSMAYVPSAFRVWVNRTVSPTWRSPTVIVLPPLVMTVELVRVMVRVQPSSVASEICGALIARIVIGPRPTPPKDVPRCFSPLAGLPALSGCDPSPGSSLESGFSVAPAEAEAPTATVGSVDGDGRMIDEDRDRQGETRHEHEADAYPLIRTTRARVRWRSDDRLDGFLDHLGTVADWWRDVAVCRRQMVPCHTGRFGSGIPRGLALEGQPEGRPLARHGWIEEQLTTHPAHEGT